MSSPEGHNSAEQLKIDCDELRHHLERLRGLVFRGLKFVNKASDLKPPSAASPRPELPDNASMGGYEELFRQVRNLLACSRNCGNS